MTLSTIPSGPRVLISVVTWNSGSAILPCLKSLEEQTFAADLLVVDNASGDGTLELVRSRHPRADTIALSSNTGFCGGHNVALRRALVQGYDYVWLVNDDTRCAPETLASLVRAMEDDPEVGVLSPVIVNADAQGERHVEFCGAALDPRLLRKHKAKNAADFSSLAADKALVPMVSGCAILLRRTLIERIGLLHEHLFAYFDDDDLSVRCGRAAAHVRMCFDAEVWHDNPPFAARSTQYHYLMARNRWLFWTDFFGGRLGFARCRRLLARTLREAGSLAGRGHTQSARAALGGVMDAMRRRTGPPPARHTLNNIAFKLLNWHPFFLARLLHANDDT